MSNGPIENHANKRARQRYKTKLNKKDYLALIALIHQNKAILIERYGFKSNWLVEYKNKKMLLVYDEVKRWIITFLPYKKGVDKNEHM